MSRKELQALGSIRESLSKNPLLIQTQVGKVRNRCLSLPPTNFTYGIQTYNKDGGVAQAMNDWQTHNITYSEYVPPPGKDFIALNKASVLGGLTTAEEQQHYRNTHDIRRRRKEPKKREEIKIPDITFGMPTRPSTPIYNLLENKFQWDWIAERRAVEKKVREEEMAKKLRKKVYETRATLLRRFSEPVEPPPYWKMKRWSTVPAHYQTFPSEKAKSDAFEYHSSDAISRTGVWGHGIYQAAKS